MPAPAVAIALFPGCAGLDVALHLVRGVHRGRRAPDVRRHTQYDQQQAV